MKKAATTSGFFPFTKQTKLFKQKLLKISNNISRHPLSGKAGFNGLR
jgi:hypothetical protein